GPIGRTVYDVAAELGAIAGPDPSDPATADAPSVASYTAGLTTSALQGKKIAVISSTTAPYPAVVGALQAAGATTTTVTVGTPSRKRRSMVKTESERDLDAYLGGTTGPGAKSLQAIIDYDNATPVEGLKYQQGELLATQSVALSAPATAATYQSDLASG